MSNVFTYKDKLKLMHLRGGDNGKKILPQPITFRIAPRELEIQIMVMSTLLDWADDEKEKKIITDSHARLQKLLNDADVYEGFFLPLKNNEWSEYIVQKTSYATILANHLCDDKGQRVFSTDDEEFIKSKVFIEAAAFAILEASEVVNSLSRRVTEEKTRTLELLGKLSAKTTTSPLLKGSTQDMSSPDTSTSNPGSEQPSSV